MQGWTDLTVPNNNWGPQFWEAEGRSDAHAGGFSVKRRLPPHANFPGGADLTRPILWLLSPHFRLSGAGDLALWPYGVGINPLRAPPANGTDGAFPGSRFGDQRPQSANEPEGHPAEKKPLATSG